MAINAMLISSAVAAILNTGNVPDLPTSELNCMVEAVFFEAGNQSMVGKIGVASVIKNRMEDESGIFPKSICGVTHQKGQFSYHKTNKRWYKFVVDDPVQKKQLTDASMAALGVLTGKFKDPTHGALYFANLGVATDRNWLKGMKLTTKLDDHSFYRKAVKRVRS